jgi:hypothetical protein
MRRDQLDRFACAAVDRLANVRSQQIDNNGPSGPENVDMRRRMVVRIYDHP